MQITLTNKRCGRKGEKLGLTTDSRDHTPRRREKGELFRACCVENKRETLGTQLPTTVKGEIPKKRKEKR